MKFLVLVSALVLFTTGCLERKETMKIKADGSVQVQVKVEGDEEDVLNGHQLPKSAPWKIKQWKEKDESNKKETYHYLAEVDFKNISDYNEDLKPLNLKIENSLEVKKKGNKTYYYFKRQYGARDFWKYEVLRKEEINEKLADKVSEDGIGALKEKDQIRFLKGLASFERKKRLLLASDALGLMQIETQFPVALIETALEEINQKYQTILTHKLLEEFLVLATQEGNDEALAKKTSEIESTLDKVEKKAFEQVFQNYSKIDYQKFLQQVKTQYSLTEDLTDENFKFNLQMPGKILMTNGKRKQLSESEEQIIWEFSGKDLINRHIPITAVSVVENN